MTSLSLEDGYAAQREMERAWVADGRTPCGWKVGLTSVEAQQRLGSEGPCFGRLFSHMALANAATVESGRFSRPRIEAEIAFRLGKDVDPEVFTTDAIDQMLPAIEIVDSRHPNGPRGPGELVADNVSGAGYVLGAALPFETSFDFEGCRAQVHVNGATSRKGLGSSCLGSPLLSLRWLSSELPRRGRLLRAGDLVLAGSLVTPLAAEPGDDVHVEIDGLGSVVVSFAEAA